MFACNGGDLATVKVLMEHGADPLINNLVSYTHNFTCLPSRLNAEFSLRNVDHCTYCDVTRYYNYAQNAQKIELLTSLAKIRLSNYLSLL